MKKMITLVLLCSAALVNAQAFKGKGDIKAQVAASIQSGGTGIFGSTDFGLGENFSIGVTATYLLDANGLYNPQKPFDKADDLDFYQKIDAKFRFNANLGKVIGLPDAMDLYPGLNIGIHNFGTHIGFRYFFSEGFGVFTEASVPITKYEGKTYGNEVFHNQFVFNIGASVSI